MSDTATTKVVTGKVRFSYANVHEPKAMDESSTPKYSVSLLIPKSDTKTINAIKAAVEAAKVIGKSKYWNGKIPNSAIFPLRDGDEERGDDENYAGHMFVNASSLNKPPLIDADKNEIMVKTDFYSGCYGRASVNFYPFPKGKKGVACGINILQKLQDGDPLSGGGGSASDFDDDFEEGDGLM